MTKTTNTRSLLEWLSSHPEEMRLLFELGIVGGLGLTAFGTGGLIIVRNHRTK